MLRPEIGSPGLELMKPIFYALWSVRIRSIYTGKLLSDFSKFETFNAQELDDVILFQVHQIGLSIICNLYLGWARQFFPGESPIVTASMNFP
jgi:hypothetical protein